MKKEACSLCWKVLKPLDYVFTLKEEIIWWEQWSEPKITLKEGDKLCGECVRDIIDVQERYPSTEPEIIY